MMLSYPFTSQVTYDDQGLPLYDRAVDSKFLRMVYARYFSDGVFFKPTNALQVVADTGMQVVVEPGACHIQGAIGLEENRRTLVVQASEQQDRIDTVVARLDLSVAVRSVDLYVVKGNASESPQPPALTRDATTWELGLANLFIAKNTGSISQQRITDTRLDTDRCGTVAQAPGDFDTSPYFAQLQAAIDQYGKDTAAQLAEIQAQAEAQLANQEADFTAWFGVKETEFSGWFETIKGKLGEDPAGSLQNQVDALNAAVTGYPLKLTAGTNALQITAKRDSVESVKVTGGSAGGQSGGLQMVEITFTGSENWDMATTSPQFGNVFLLTPSVAAKVDVATSTAFFSIAIPVAFNDRVSLEQHWRCYVDEGGRICIRMPSTNPFASAQAFKIFLQQQYAAGTPLKGWYIPADVYKATGMYIPIEMQGAEYRCQMLPISEALTEGDVIETNVSSNCDQKIILDGTADISAITTTFNNVYRISANISISYAPKVEYSNSLFFIENYEGDYEHFYIMGYRIFIFINKDKIKKVDASGVLAYLSEHPIIIVFQSKEYEKQNDLPISLETHANGHRYAHNPVAIPTDDGATTITAPEGTTLEVSVARNEAKEYKATLTSSGWQSSSDAYVQTAEVRCVEGPGFVTPDSKFDSGFWVNQTEDLAENEAMTDALGPVSYGYATLGGGTITCRVSEKPTRDLEIHFRAKR